MALLRNLVKRNLAQQELDELAIRRRIMHQRRYAPIGLYRTIYSGEDARGWHIFHATTIRAKSRGRAMETVKLRCLYRQRWINGPIFLDCFLIDV